jgi:hypothetical protein
MHRDWSGRFTPLWEASLAQLKQRAEAAEGRTRRPPPRRRASG